MEQEISLKKTIQQKIVKEASLNGVIGMIVFVIFSLINSSFEAAIIKGMVLGIVFFISVALWSKNSWKKRVKKLQSKRYESLNELGIGFNDDLYFEGVYNGFMVRILPVVENDKNNRIIEYDIIQAFYESKSGNTDNSDKAEIIDYYLGELHFFDKWVCFIPKDFIKPNYKDNLDGLISILNREDYKPIKKEELPNL